MFGPTSVLDECRSACGKITRRAITEPAGPSGHIRMLGHTEFALRALYEGTICLDRPGQCHRRLGRPAVLSQQLLWPVHGQAKSSGCSRGQIKKTEKLTVFVAFDIRKALCAPGHDSGEVVTRRRRVGAPEFGDHRLPGLLPGELTCRDVTSGCTNVGAKCEEVVELTEEVHVPRVTLLQRELCKDGI